MNFSLSINSIASSRVPFKPKAMTPHEPFGKMAYMTKATAQLMRDLGSIQSPQNAFLLNLGLENVW